MYLLLEMVLNSGVFFSADVNMGVPKPGRLKNCSTSNEWQTNGRGFDSHRSQETFQLGCCE